MRVRVFFGSIAALLGVLVAAETVAAQVSVGVGRPGGVGVATPNYSLQYGRGGYYPGSYYGGYYPGYYGGYLQYPNDGGWYSSYPRSQSYYSYPGQGYYSRPTRYTDPGWMTNSGESRINQASYDRPSENQIALRVNVPDARARVWIEGQPTRQMGTERVYLSPPLEPGKTYTYTVRAAWMANGREMTEEKKQEGQPGQEVAINFTDRSDRMPATTESRDRPGVADPNIRPTAAAGAVVPHEGKVVEAGNGKLTMSAMDGTNQHTHAVAPDAPITCDGKACKLEDLQQGCHVKVTTGTDQKTAMKIEARSAERAKEPQP